MYSYIILYSCLYQDEELAAICAQQYYIDEGTMDVNKLENNLPSYLPDFEMSGKEMALEKWTQTIMHQYRKVICELKL